MKKGLSIVFIFILILGISSCKSFYSLKKKYGVYISNYYYLDTISNVVVEYKKNEQTAQEVKDKLSSIDSMLLDIEKEFSIAQTINMSQNKIEKSTLMEINEKSGKEAVCVSTEFIKVLKEAIIISNKTNKMFNPAIGVLSQLWNISAQAEFCDNNNSCKIPSQEEIDEACALIKIEDIVIDEINQTVYLKSPGMKLDLGAIVKGYAADLLLEYLIDENCSYISVNLGGNIKTYGKSYLANTYTKDATIVPVGIENPNLEVFNNNIIMEVMFENQSIVTSSTNKRYIKVWDQASNNYKIYHHILNPKTGYPVQNDIVSVTIIGPSSMICDGLSTGVFMLGVLEGIKVLQNEKYMGIIITNDLKIYIVGNINYKLQKGLEKVYQIIKL